MLHPLESRCRKIFLCPWHWDTTYLDGFGEHSNQLQKLRKSGLLLIFSLILSSTAILLGYPQPLPHVRSVWIHLDAPERALPEPLPTRTISPDVPHHPASFPLHPGARREVRTHPVLQLQPVRPTHEPRHMELFLQPQLQLTTLQRLRLLWRCLKEKKKI